MGALLYTVGGLFWGGAYELRPVIVWFIQVLPTKKTFVSVMAMS